MSDRQTSFVNMQSDEALRACADLVDKTLRTDEDLMQAAAIALTASAAARNLFDQARAELKRRGYGLGGADVRLLDPQ